MLFFIFYWGVSISFVIPNRTFDWVFQFTLVSSHLWFYFCLSWFLFYKYDKYLVSFFRFVLFWIATGVFLSEICSTGPKKRLKLLMLTPVSRLLLIYCVVFSTVFIFSMCFLRTWVIAQPLTDDGGPWAEIYILSMTYKVLRMCKLHKFLIFRLAAIYFVINFFNRC